MSTYELPRVSPECVGIPSGYIEELIRKLDGCGTQMHGIMIARYGKVCAEGWWAPFAPQTVHGLQSMTKAVLSMAVGALVTDGLLDIDRKVAELVPEWMPENPSERLRRLTVRHMLTMSAGSRKTYPACKEDWLKGFFAQPLEDEPGTVFHYDGTNTSAIGAIVSKISGEKDILSYLRKRVFDPIGINSDHVKWVKHPDGYRYCGGGAFMLLEDVLRLGMLCEQDGCWDGKEILSPRWVKAATSKQMHNYERTGVPEYSDDSSSGYGFQIWMTKRPGTYYFSGAHGQYVLVMPDKHLVIALFENIPEVLPKPNEKRGPKSTDMKEVILGHLKAFGEEILDEALLPDPEAERRLERYLNCLSCPKERVAAVSPKAGEFFGYRWDLTENDISLLPGVYSSALKKFVLCTTADGPVGISRIGLKDFDGDQFTLELESNGVCYRTPVGVDGLYRAGYFRVPGHPELPSKILAHGVWNGNMLEITLKYIETCYFNRIQVIRDAETTRIVFLESYMFDDQGYRTEFLCRGNS